MIEKWKPPSFADKAKALLSRHPWVVSLLAAVLLIFAFERYMRLTIKYDLDGPRILGAIYYAVMKGQPYSLVPLAIFALVLMAAIRLLAMPWIIDAIWAIGATWRRLAIFGIVVVLLAAWGWNSLTHSRIFASTTGVKLAHGLIYDARIKSNRARGAFSVAVPTALRFCVVDEYTSAVEAARALMPNKPITYVEYREQTHSRAGRISSLLKPWHVIVELENKAEIYEIWPHVLAWPSHGKETHKDYSGCWAGALIDLSRKRRKPVVIEFLPASQLP